MLPMTVPQAFGNLFGGCPARHAGGGRPRGDGRAWRAWKLALGLWCAGSWAASALADETARGIRLVQPATTSWRFGVQVQAGDGRASGIVVTLPVPRDWPEQRVVEKSQEKTANVASVTFREVDGAVKQMVVTIPRLAAGETAQASVTYQVTKSQIDPPETTALYQAPPRPNAALRKYLQPSPYIESRDATIVALAGQIGQGQEGWNKAEALFDWVRANVQYEFAEAIKPATAALADRRGDCEELSSLFIALCRASQIPARAVWVPGHTYPEFYLVDDRGQGHWFPCQIAGQPRQFGMIRETRPILQKGDALLLPGQKEPQRYAAPRLSARDAAAPLTLTPIIQELGRDTGP